LKKLVLWLITLATLCAYQYDAKFYVGMGGGIQNESFTGDTDASNAPYFGSVKIGYGDTKAYGIEFLLNYIANDSNIFSPNDGNRYGMDVALVKAWPLSSYAYPNIRAGFGAGEMKIERNFEDTAAYSSFNIGGGVFIPIDASFYAEINYEYRFTSYKSMDLISEKVKLQSHINQLYFGINYKF
jgi:opacity protein-like surface antigen